MTETQELLAKFVRNRSESAFRELVTRYVDLVYSTAVRLVHGDTHTAEDVSQIVFADLARKAAKLPANTTLGGWLHRHTSFVARTVMRGEHRRQARERQAVEMSTVDNPTEDVFNELAPILDDAIQELGEDDREPILLRFFERRNLRSVGEALGINENVAQKRVARAVQELGIVLQRRGVRISAAALAAGLGAGAVTAAPAGLSLSISGTAIAAGISGSAALTSAKAVGIGKLKLGIVAAVVAVSAVTTFLLLNQSKASLRQESPPVQQQATEVPLQESVQFDSTPSNRQAGSASLTDSALPGAIKPAAIPKPVSDIVSQPARPSAVVPQRIVAVNAAGSAQRFYARSGSRIRIEGTSTVHDWQAESKIIGGFLEVGSDFLDERGQTFRLGPVQANAEAYVGIRSLLSVEKNGAHYHDKMDEVMWNALRFEQYPKIHYRLVEMSLVGTTNYNNNPQCEFDSRGELVIAGVTNEIVMPIFVLPLDQGKLKVSGEVILKMTSFKIEPPGFSGFKVGDDVRVLFDWIVGTRREPTTLSPNALVPLILELPAPAFRGTPKDLQLGKNVEPLSDKPRAPMMVPRGVKNLAPAGKLTSSDKNASAKDLARLTDKNKEASDQSIIFLRKGLQWVQMDLGVPSEIFALALWHAHNSAKVYHAIIVQVADDADFTENVRTLFNNDSMNTSGLGTGTDREYFESYEGKLINAKGAEARYIRFYSKGSTESALNEYTEIEVYGRAAQ